MQPSNFIIFLGGLAFGTASGLLLLLNGRIAGFSSMLAGVLMPERDSLSWKAFFVAGAVVAGAVTAPLFPGAVPATYETPFEVVLVGGFLVGVGTRVGNGCTSGHGVCGMGRLSKRSIVATLTFVTTGIVAVAFMRFVVGGV